MKVTIHDPLKFEVIGSGLGFPEGPVVTGDGTVYAVDIDGGRVLRIARRRGDRGGGAGRWSQRLGARDARPRRSWPTTGVSSGVRSEAGVRIPIDRATHTNEPPGFTGGWIERVSLTTGEVTVLHRECAGPSVAGAQRPGVRCGGGLWFTDHGKGRHGSVDRGGLYYIPPDGDAVREVAFPLLGPNGVGLSPDGAGCTWPETHTGRLWAWDLSAPGQVEPAAGSLAVRHGGRCVAATPYSLRLPCDRGGWSHRDRSHRRRPGRRHT